METRNSYLLGGELNIIHTRCFEPGMHSINVKKHLKMPFQFCLGSILGENYKPKLVDIYMNIHAYVIMYILIFLINDNDWVVNLVLWSHTIYHVLSSPKTKANIKINLHKHLYTRLQGTCLFIFCYSFESFCSEFSSFIPPLRYDTAFTHLATLPNVRVRMEFRFLSTKG